MSRTCAHLVTPAPNPTKATMDPRSTTSEAIAMNEEFYEKQRLSPIDQTMYNYSSKKDAFK
jgi:hypothetical protein